MVRFWSIAAYVRTEKADCRVRTYAAKRQYSPLWGSCPPAIEGEVGLHKGFDAHKAPDTPPGRIDDVVGGFQITSHYSVTEKSTSCRSPCMAFLPPSGGVFRLSHLGVIAGYPMQTVMRFSRFNRQNGNKKAVTKQTSPAFAFSGRSC